MSACRVADESSTGNVLGGVAGTFERSVKTVGSAYRQRRHCDPLQVEAFERRDHCPIIEQSGPSRRDWQYVFKHGRHARLLGGARMFYDIGWCAKNSPDHAGSADVLRGPEDEVRSK